MPEDRKGVSEPPNLEALVCWRVWLSEYPDEGSVPVFLNFEGTDEVARRVAAEVFSSAPEDLEATRDWWAIMDGDGYTIHQQRRASDSVNTEEQRPAAQIEVDLINELLSKWDPVRP